MADENQELCLKCMECCKGLAFSTPFKDDNPLAIEFYKARGCGIHSADGNLMVSINIDCPNLTSFGCRIYEERPIACRIFDGRKHIVTKDKCLLK